MRIRHISVKNLFGIFDHDIPLNSEERITIVYGPNGFGKTYTLSLVNELFNPGYHDFYSIPFDEVSVALDDGSTICLRKREDNGHEALSFKLTGPDGATETFACVNTPCGDAGEPPWFSALKEAVKLRFVHTDRLVRFKREQAEDSLHAITDCMSEFREMVADRPAEFDRMIDKIRLIERVINSRFNHKQLSISQDRGFIFTTQAGRQLDPESLSSGEQHIVMLLYELLFKVEPDSLILIDEPELSLHIVWQQEFVRDLLEIIRLGGFDILIATHSPQIIHDRWDLTVELKGPVE